MDGTVIAMSMFFFFPSENKNFAVSVLKEEDYILTKGHRVFNLVVPDLYSFKLQ